MPAVRRPGKSFAPRSAPPRAAAARPGQSVRPARSERAPAPAPAAPASATAAPAPPDARSDEKGRRRAPNLFQKFFKSTNPNAYAAQIKRSTNGNHYLVLTEGSATSPPAKSARPACSSSAKTLGTCSPCSRRRRSSSARTPSPKKSSKSRQRFWAKKSNEPDCGAHAAPRPAPPGAPRRRPAAERQALPSTPPRSPLETRPRAATAERKRGRHRGTEAGFRFEQGCANSGECFSGVSDTGVPPVLTSSHGRDARRPCHVSTLPPSIEPRFASPPGESSWPPCLCASVSPPVFPTHSDRNAPGQDLHRRTPRH